MATFVCQDCGYSWSARKTLVQIFPIEDIEVVEKYLEKDFEKIGLEFSARTATLVE